MRQRSHPGAGRGRFALLAAGAVALGAVAALSAGCSTAKHHRVLSFFFDGVPEPEAAVSATPEVQAAVGRQLVRPGEHGPFAAKLCDSCHDSQATNALVAPVEQLCVRCHELGEAKAYVHGPLASGGCTVCHDPHRSANRFLLVSASDGFCLSCHDRAALSVAPGPDGVDAHAGEAANCTDCHEAHMSDRRHLLREGK
jgi:predicted CXXCH cytochrome family protein